jgi:hypothetical protein
LRNFPRDHFIPKAQRLQGPLLVRRVARGYEVEHAPVGAFVRAVKRVEQGLDGIVVQVHGQTVLLATVDLALTLADVARRQLNVHGVVNLPGMKQS